MSITNQVLSVAREQIGIMERPANSNNVKFNTWYYGRTVSGNGYPWCMAFVQWCFNEIGKKLPYTTASCSSLLNWYKKNKPECVVKIPKAGDIIIYNFGHTGIVESVGKGTITAIEGNTSATDYGSQDNGGCVARKVRKTSLVTAYIRPYEDVKIEEDEEMVRYVRLSDIPTEYGFRDIINTLMDAKIINGDGSDPNGNNDIIDLSHDQVRSLVFEYRGGAFDRKLIAMGMSPAVNV